MNPALVIQDFGGVHNGDLGKTRARLMRGGTWKKQRIVLVIPTADMIDAKVCLSMWNLIMPPNQGVCRILATGDEVGIAYSQAIEGVLAHPDLSQWEFLMCHEHDNLGPQDGILKLIETLEAHPEMAAVSGLYFCKGEGGCAQIWGDPTDPIVNYRPQIPQPECVQECMGIGQGFALFRLQMFKDQRIPKPWFKTRASKDGVGTQDLAFWTEARKFGYRCCVDTRVKVGHLDLSSGTVW